MTSGAILSLPTVEAYGQSTDTSTITAQGPKSKKVLGVKKTDDSTGETYLELQGMIKFSKTIGGKLYPDIELYNGTKVNIADYKRIHINGPDRVNEPNWSRRSQRVSYNEVCQFEDNAVLEGHPEGTKITFSYQLPPFGNRHRVVLMLSGKHNVEIRNIIIDGRITENDERGNDDKGTVGIWAQGSNNLTIDKCKISHVGFCGIIVGGSNDLTISNCEFTEISWPGWALTSTLRGASYQHAIYFPSRVKNATIENCHFHNLFNTGGDINLATRSTSEMAIEDITIKDCKFDGGGNSCITVQQVKNLTISGLDCRGYSGFFYIYKNDGTISIDNCEIHGGVGVQIRLGDSKNLTIRKSRFKELNGPILHSRGGFGVTFEENEFELKTSVLVAITPGSNGYHATGGINFKKNTIHFTDQPGTYCFARTEGNGTAGLSNVNVSMNTIRGGKDLRLYDDLLYLRPDAGVSRKFVDNTFID
jgi:parallel beta-helix repeat protein